MAAERRRPGEGGAPGADEFAPLVYDELRRIAAAYMRRERPGQTLQPTALVNEAYLRLARAGSPWQDKRHFVGIAARSMRQILVERARARGDADEVLAILPRRAGAREPQVGLVHERRRLNRLPRPLAPHVRSRNSPKLMVNLGRGFIGRRTHRDIVEVRSQK